MTTEDPGEVEIYNKESTEGTKVSFKDPKTTP